MAGDGRLAVKSKEVKSLPLLVSAPLSGRLKRGRVEQVPIIPLLVILLL